MLHRSLPFSMTLGAIALSAAPAAAQTWTGNRTTPAISELVAIDATGEPSWPFGFEDLAGDGTDFGQQEQSIDIRTAYAVADGQTFWARTYVSDDNAAGGNIVVFVFIDADDSPLTGGGADATEINALFTNDPTPGGYEFVIEIGGNAMINDIWEWDGAMFAPLALMPNDNADAEAGQDGDPLDLGGLAHGYLQGMVDLNLVGLDSTCDAGLFFRSVNEGGMIDGDLNVATVAPCIPVDADDDGVPDFVVPEEGCTDDDDCPFFGVCVDGECVLPGACLDDGDCDPDEFCNDDGICFPNPGGDCTDDSDCGDLVCDDGTCQPCDLGGDQCGPGRVCTADGRCIDGNAGGAGGGDGLGLEPGDNVQGGAFTCAIADVPSSRWALVVLGLGLVSLLGRRSMREGDRE